MATWNKLFSNFAWKNKPDTSTPLGQTLLNRLNNAINGIDDRVVTLNTQKVSTDEIQGVFTDVRLIKNTGQFVFTLFDGTQKIIDTALEKISINVSFDKETQMMVLEKEDGSKEYVDLSVFITPYEFVSSPTIQQTVTDGKVRADIKPNSITDQMLQTNYLADITTQANTAVSASQSALESQSLAEQSAEKSEEEADRAKAEADRAEEAAGRAEAVVGITVDTTLDTNSTNPIANKAVAEALINVDAKTLDGHEAEYFAPLEARTPKLVAQLPSTTTESEINNTLDNLSASYPNETLYEVQVNWGIAHSKFGGGKFVVSGWKYTDIYETQTISNDAWNYSYIRKKNRNGWQPWVKSATDADLAKYLPLDGGGDVTANSAFPIRITNSGGVTCCVRYSGKDGLLGEIGVNGTNNPIFRKTDGTNNTILHTGNMASHVLPLDGGGTVQRDYMAPVVLKNKSGTACFTGYYNVNGEMGYLGFDGNLKPTYQQANGTKNELLHTGNITDYVSTDSETGTFTLKLDGVTLVTGTYYKVGKMVHCRATGNFSQNVSTGYHSLTGFPFANASLNGSIVDFHTHHFFGKASDNLVFNVGASEITLNVTASIGQNQPFTFSAIYFTA